MKLLDAGGLASLWANVKAYVTGIYEQALARMESLEAAKVRSYTNVAGTAAKTSSPYHCACYDVSDEDVSEYRDGMVVHLRVPVAGNGSYGTAFQINDLGYKPIVYGTNSMITTRYPAGGVIVMTYNANQTGTLYLGNGSQTVQGCWQVMDYYSDTIAYNIQHNAGSRTATEKIGTYCVCVAGRDNSIQPLNVTGGTGTAKVMTSLSFDPFQEFLCAYTSANAGATIANSKIWTRRSTIDWRYTFNCGQTLTASKPLYLVVDLQDDGLVKLATNGNPWAQELPKTADGHLYIFLGYVSNTYQGELYDHHPVYYHDGTGIRHWAGQKLTRYSGSVVGSWE